MLGIVRAIAAIGLWASGLLLGAGCRQILGFESAANPTEDAAPQDGEPDGPVLVEDTLTPDMTAEGWALRKPITIDRTEVEGSHTGFPLLVRLAADADLADSARSDGFDLLFMASDGTTKLAHEIERFDDETGELVAWVRLPTLSNNADTVIFLYFGNPLAPDQQDAPAVWDSAYLGVWHLDETAGAIAADSTGNARDGTKAATTAPASVAGIISGGQQFAGNLDRIEIGNQADLDVPNLTFEAWVSLPACGDVFRRLLDLPTAFSRDWMIAYSCEGTAATGPPRALYLDRPGLTLTPHSPLNSLSAAVPHHVVIVSDPTAIFIDGVAQTITSAPIGFARDSTVAVVGNQETAENRGTVGTMDEVRISNVSRSQTYVETSFANQRPGSTFLTVGATEMAPPLP